MLEIFIMSDFWDERYKNDDFVYGTEPNAVFKTFIDQESPGKLLLPAEGEGRNAVYAASKGWDVFAFDSSSEALKKAKRLAESKNVIFNYQLSDLQNYLAEKDLYDVIALIYVHQSPPVRQKFHLELIRSLKKGGKLFLLAFSQSQINNNSGGPKDKNLLYDIELIRNDFKKLEMMVCEELQLHLEEGPWHTGVSNNILYIGRKS